MDNLDFLRPAETDRQTITATVIDEAKMAAVAIIKSKTNNTAHAFRYIEPLGDGAKQPPHVEAMDENGDILKVTINEFCGTQYELQFMRYTIDDEALQRMANRPRRP